ncbi:MAG TPA: DUF296 domain-containing protein [Burkholderiaceae bacterium]|nr:DUF296 domain-containing protein [Burkholderiaceae bacterium]
MLSYDGAHLHMSVADEAGQVFDGHVCFGNIIRTVEVLLVALPGWNLSRAPDPSTGYRELRIRRRVKRGCDLSRRRHRYHAHRTLRDDGAIRESKTARRRGSTAPARRHGAGVKTPVRTGAAHPHSRAEVDRASRHAELSLALPGDVVLYLLLPVRAGRGDLWHGGVAAGSGQRGAAPAPGPVKIAALAPGLG